DGTTYIHLLLGDTFGGVTVSPRTGSYILGWTEGPGIFQFTTPVQRFGAYWANNSTVAVARVVVSGNGVLNGFLWFDDLEATVPAPGAAVLLGIGLPWLARRRR